jgi:hypothetical protein
MAVYKAESSNATVTYNGVNVTAYCNQNDLDAVVTEVDTTNLASTGAESSPAATDWSVKMQGFLDKASDDVFGPDALTAPATLRNLVITRGPTGAQAIYTWTGTTTEGAGVNNYQLPGTDPKNLNTWTADLLISGGPVRTEG